MRCRAVGSPACPMCGRRFPTIDCQSRRPSLRASAATVKIEPLSQGDASRQRDDQWWSRVPRAWSSPGSATSSSPPVARGQRRPHRRPRDRVAGQFSDDVTIRLPPTPQNPGRFRVAWSRSVPSWNARARHVDHRDQHRNVRVGRGTLSADRRDDILGSPAQRVSGRRVTLAADWPRAAIGLRLI